MCVRIEKKITAKNYFQKRISIRIIQNNCKKKKNCNKIQCKNCKRANNEVVLIYQIEIGGTCISNIKDI